MISVSRFYNDIFSTLHFSITGYNDIAKSLDNYFSIIARNSFFFEHKEIKFLSFAFSQLKDDRDGLIEWETTSINNQKNFLFHSYHGNHIELILDLYYSIRGHLTTLEDNGKINVELRDEPTAEVIAKLFNHHPSFRVDASNKNDVILEFEQRLFLLTFQIPFIELFHESKNFDEVVLQTIHKVTELDTIDQNFNIVKNKNTYEWKSENANHIYLEIRRVFLDNFDNDKIIACRKKVINQIRYFENQHKIFFDSNNLDNYIRHWANSIIAGGFLSHIFDAYMEYIPGVCNVDEGKNRDSKNKYKSLGAMIVGYDKKDNISDDLRAVFRIMSDRISSAIAGNYLKNQYEKMAYPDLILESSKCFGIEGIKELTHGGESYYSKENALENAKSKIASLNRLVNTLQKTNSQIMVDSFKKQLDSFSKQLEAISFYNGKPIQQLQKTRNELELTGDAIKDKLLSLNLDKLKYIEWDSGELKMYINPADILLDDITEMLNSIIGDKGLKLPSCYFTIYTCESENKPESNNKFPIKLFDSYLIFCHQNAKRIDGLNLPNWFNRLGKSIRYVGDNFYYSTIVDNERKYYNLEYVEVEKSHDIKLITNKFNFLMAKLGYDFPVWYIIKFQTYKQ